MFGNSPRNNIHTLRAIARSVCIGFGAVCYSKKLKFNLVLSFQLSLCHSGEGWNWGGTQFQKLFRIFVSEAKQKVEKIYCDSRSGNSSLALSFST